MDCAAPALRCRQIGEADIAIVAALLKQGFPNRTRQFWRDALRRLAHREPPPGFPKYGFLLERGEVPVGAILMIYSTLLQGDRVATRCNLSSWYVAPEYRAYASLLVSHALSHKDVTYLNVSAAPHSLPIIEAQGFAPYCEGIFIALPALSDRTKRYAFLTQHRHRQRPSRHPIATCCSAMPSSAASACGARTPNVPTRSCSGPASPNASCRARS